MGVSGVALLERRRKVREDPNRRHPLGCVLPQRHAISEGGRGGEREREKTSIVRLEAITATAPAVRSTALRRRHRAVARALPMSGRAVSLHPSLLPSLPPPPSLPLPLGVVVGVVVCDVVCDVPIERLDWRRWLGRGLGLGLGLGLGGRLRVGRRGRGLRLRRRRIGGRVDRRWLQWYEIGTVAAVKINAQIGRRFDSIILFPYSM